MALLKKIRSATLIESLVATVLIVVVFFVASLILNNLLLNSFSNNTHSVEQRITELEYQLQHNNIRLPYTEEYNNWDIELKYESRDNNTWIYTSAVNFGSNKEVTKRRLYETH